MDIEVKLDIPNYSRIVERDLEATRENLKRLCENISEYRDAGEETILMGTAATIKDVLDVGDFKIPIWIDPSMPPDEILVINTDLLGKLAQVIRNRVYGRIEK